MLKQMKEKIKSIFQWIQNRIKWSRMDRIWELYGGSCFGFHPPSFYYKHSEEEIRRIEQEEIRMLKEKIDELQMKSEQKG